MQFIVEAVVKSKHALDSKNQIVVWEINGTGIRFPTDNATANQLILGKTYVITCDVVPKP